MKHLCIQTEQDVRLAKEIYQKITDTTSAMVFLHDKNSGKYFVFGHNAVWLNKIIDEIDMELLYPTSTIDDDLYYEIQKLRFVYLLSEVILRDIETLII